MLRGDLWQWCGGSYPSAILMCKARQTHRGHVAQVKNGIVAVAGILGWLPQHNLAHQNWYHLFLPFRSLQLLGREIKNTHKNSQKYTQNVVQKSRGGINYVNSLVCTSFQTLHIHSHINTPINTHLQKIPLFMKMGSRSTHYFIIWLIDICEKGQLALITPKKVGIVPF